MLTLEQVKKAGLFAWHGPWLVFIPGEGVRLAYAGGDVLPASAPACVGNVEVSRLPRALPEEGARRHFSMDTAIGWAPPEGGWRHLPACDCEFCEGGAPQ